MGTKGNCTLQKTWKEKSDGGPLLQLEISPTISLESQSSRLCTMAKAANLTLRAWPSQSRARCRQLLDCDAPENTQ